jgi:uncharacterized membrane protein
MPSPWELHPALVHFPIAFFAAAVLLDVYAAWRRKRELLRPVAGLLAAGALTGLAAAAAGFIAYLTVPALTDEARALLLWHFGLNAAALALLSVIAMTRWRYRDLTPSPDLRVLTALAVLAVLVAAYLGGRIVYRGGAGIDPQVLAPELRAHAQN